MSRDYNINRLSRMFDLGPSQDYSDLRPSVSIRDSLNSIASKKQEADQDSINDETSLFITYRNDEWMVESGRNVFTSYRSQISEDYSFKKNFAGHSYYAFVGRHSLSGYFLICFRRIDPERLLESRDGTAEEVGNTFGKWMDEMNSVFKDGSGDESVSFTENVSTGDSDTRTSSRASASSWSSTSSTYSSTSSTSSTYSSTDSTNGNGTDYSVSSSTNGNGTDYSVSSSTNGNSSPSLASLTAYKNYLSPAPPPFLLEKEYPPTFLVYIFLQSEDRRIFSVQRRDFEPGVSGTISKVFGTRRPKERDLKKFCEILMDLSSPRAVLGRYKFKPVQKARVDSLVSRLESENNPNKFKAGVIYMTSKNYRTSLDLLSPPQNVSSEFEYFLGLIGERVRLKGFEKYSGGLDTTNDENGKYSYYKSWKISSSGDPYQFMFHVVPMIRTSLRDTTKNEIKKFIDTDHVVIVFIEGNVKYSTKLLQSGYTHLIIAVKLHSKKSDTKSYLVEIARKTATDEFGPFLPEFPVLKETEIAEFLWSKIANGVKKIHKSGKFKLKYEKYVLDGLEGLYY